MYLPSINETDGAFVSVTGESTLSYWSFDVLNQLMRLLTISFVRVAVDWHTLVARASRSLEAQYVDSESFWFSDA